MMGISYGGFTALQVATTQPPHLRSIIPMHFTDNRYTDDCHYVGGHPRLYYDIGFYGNFMVAYNALPPAPEWCPDWAQIWQQHLDGNQPFLLSWLAHQPDGPYWRHGSVGDIADRIQCPVFMIGGWGDGYRNAPLRLYDELTCPKRVLIGPWNHAVPDAATPGPRVDHLQEVVDWLDHWCGRTLDEHAKGTKTAPIVVYEQRFDPPVDPDRTHQPGRWRAETSWPPMGLEEVTYYFGAASSLNPQPGDDASDQLRYDATVGTTAGLWSAGVPFGLSSDQRPDEALSTTYTTAPLTESVHILGRPTVHLHAATSATVLGFVASLSDVAPDGSSQLVAKGILNATRRDSLTEPQPLVPGEEYELQIEVDTTSWHFQPGHRMRVSIANADWPNVWPTPEPAVSTLHHGHGSPSRLTLPTVPATSAVQAPTFADAPVGPTPHRDDATPPTWRIERDALSRQAWVSYHFAYTDRVNATTTVQRTYDFSTHVDPDAPDQASAYGTHTSRITRPSEIVDAVSATTVRGTATHFHVTITVDVKVNGHEHFTNAWTQSFPRILC